MSIEGVVALVVLAGIYSFFNSPGSPLARTWRQRLGELEVASRMGPPEEIISALCESAKLYRRLGKKWEAETVMRRAVQISKDNFGPENPGLAPIFKDYAKLMDSLGRKAEADKMRRQASKIEAKKR